MGIGPARATLLLVTGFSLLRLLVAGRFELSGDGAHYALYGLNLDWSYFDHPPMIGWLQALVLNFSQTEFALRLWPVSLSIMYCWVLYRFAHMLFPQASPWIGFVSVAILQSGIMFQLIALAMLPESPLLLFGLAGGMFLYRAVEQERSRDWLWVGLFLGLAGLSKYTSVTLVLSAGLLIAMRGRWHILRQPWLWLGALGALVLIAPVLWWNFQHDWVSFQYQLGHGLPAREWQLSRFLLSQAGQMLTYSPGIYLFGLIAIIAAFARRMEPGGRVSLALALPLLALFVWSSGYEETLPHWTALGWAVLSPLTALWLLDHWHKCSVRVAVYISAFYSLVFIGLIFSQLFQPWIPFSADRHPFGDLYGWQVTARRAETLRVEMAEDPGPEPVLFVGNWSFASHVAWYARPTPVQITDNRYNQSDIWFGRPQPGARGVVVVPFMFHGRNKANGITRFENCELGDEVAIVLDGKPASRYFLYTCENFQG